MNASVDTLLEALPYIREFHGRTVVIKYGGSAMRDEALREGFATDVVLLKYVGLNPVIVHGGGPEITEYMERLGLEVRFHEGLRVSDPETVEVARMVLLGKVNSDIVQRINRHGQPAVGLSGQDGSLFGVSPVPNAEQVGFVGAIDRVDVDVLNHIAADYIPVVASSASDRDGNAYNVNADEAAGKVAAALRAYKAIFLTDVVGWLADPADESTLTSRATVAEVEERLDGIEGGMRPKLTACVDAIRGGVQSAHIIDGRKPHSLLLELFTDAGIGTMVSPVLAHAERARSPRPRATGVAGAMNLTDAGLEERYLMGTYRRGEVEFVRGEGALLWDSEGREYLDLLAGISVCSVGHCHPDVVEAVREQAGRLMHTSNLFYTEPMVRLAERLSESSLGGRVFFANSGTEANECAIKIARKHAHRRGVSSPAIVSFERDFHGRTYGSLSATPGLAANPALGPMLEGFRSVPFDDAEALRDAVDGQTAAVLIEPIQGEAGIYPLSEDSLLAAREACDAVGALLILDEIQTGVGRTGSLWAYEQTPVRPDVLTSAKALGGGMAIGACITNPEAGRGAGARRPRLDLRRRPGRLGGGARRPRHRRRPGPAARREGAWRSPARGARGARRRPRGARPRPDDRRRARGGPRLGGASPPTCSGGAPSSTRPSRGPCGCSPR